MAVQRDRVSAKTKKPITVSLTIKEEKNCTISDLCNLLEGKMVEFTEHLPRIRHQYKALKNLKDSLSPSEIIVHVDFAENYCCKYGKEVQSVHFGASRAQITLHTGVLYSYGRAPQTFCTISEVTEHGSIPILAHLRKILEPYVAENPEVTTIHFLSDGPSTQYKNKIMFGLIAVTRSEIFPQLKSITWNYSE